MMAIFPFNFSASGAGGGMAIGGVVTGANADGVFFGGVGGILSQDSTNFKRTAAQLFFKTTTEDDLDGAFRLEFAGWNGSAYTTGLTIRSTDASAYYPYHIRLENAAYGTNGEIVTANAHGLHFYGNTITMLYLAVSGSAPLAQFYGFQASQPVAIFRQAASPTADALQVTRSDGTTVIWALDKDGIPISPTKTPASASAAGTAGMFAWDASYIYICTATNTWKRVAIATW